MRTQSILNMLICEKLPSSHKKTSQTNSRIVPKDHAMAGITISLTVTAGTIENNRQVFEVVRMELLRRISNVSSITKVRLVSATCREINTEAQSIRDTIDAIS